MSLHSEIFLQKYRKLEGLLEKRYDGRKINSASVVMEYIRDDDSESVRVDLDLIREIRNILSHNAGENGTPVIEPSQEMIERLDKIIDFVQKPRAAADFGTPASQILCAHLNDPIWDVMRNMQKNGYSHVPVMNRGELYGVFSVKGVFDALAINGLDSLKPDARISMLGEKLKISNHSSERYLFVPKDTSIVSVRNAFERYTERNNRLSMVFVTQTGSASEPIICMLTPWDVLNEQKPD